MWSRALAGIVAGFFLAAGVVGVISWALPGPWTSTLVGGVLAFFPMWMLTASSAFLFKSGARAWAWLGGAAALSFALLWMLRMLGWVA